MGTSSRRWRCRSCGYIYDEALGLPEQGIAPGTRFEDVPEDAFYCPDCGTEKQDFELMDY
ncbi:MULTISPECIES: rubredoxin [unclassified Novosphingobium]|jgi:rubredoxin|uniref:rubredoxin n=1 Tax=unclassified Novosphingobium TaxID=2644732 RepID=UPI00061B988B|nr:MULTISPECIES: rubredoxin [unclassified Novosphingobium]GAO53406.1 rubredoxin [Novosphingobium sp. MD-1]